MPRSRNYEKLVLDDDQRVSIARSAAVLDDLCAHAVSRRVLGAKATPGMVIPHYSKDLPSAFKVRIGKVCQQEGAVLAGRLLLDAARRGAVSSLIPPGGPDIGHGFDSGSQEVLESTCQGVSSLAELVPSSDRSRAGDDRTFGNHLEPDARDL